MDDDFGDALIDDTFDENDILLNEKEVGLPGPSLPLEKPAKTTSKRKRKSQKETGYKKAPQAPKRFKSPYILFSISRMEEYKRELGSKTKVTALSSIVADEWKKISPEERKKWDEVARKDKERYLAEKCLYTGPWQVPSKRSRKDPTAPKRPMSAFLLYSQGMRQKLRKENPTLKNTDISRLLGEQWKNAPEAERKPHIEREKREREQYNKDIAEWRRQRDEEDKAMRKHRQDVVDQWMKSGQLPQFAPQPQRQLQPIQPRPQPPHQQQPPAPQQWVAPTVVQVQGNPTTLVPPAAPTQYATYPPSQEPTYLYPPPQPTATNEGFLNPPPQPQHHQATQEVWL